ncbi:MAG: hypothetical protein ACJ75J_12560 [Cytophagaceae bacterium]
MKNFKALKIGISAAGLFLCACSAQNTGSTENDDIYYSSEDRGQIRKQQKAEEQRGTKVIETEPVKSDKNNYNFESKP